MWNPERTPPREFLEELENDEEDSGSELEVDDDEELEEMAEEDDVDDADEENMNLEDMPIYLMEPDGNLTSIYPERHDHEHQVQRRPTESWRERSPLRSRSITPPPFSPLSSPTHDNSREAERIIVNFTEVRPPFQPAVRGRGQGRGQLRTRGSRLRGGNRGRGRRAATRAVDGESGWRRGERVIEVCLQDEDVPPSLREMVYNLEAARNVRSAQQTRRRRNVRENGEENESDDEYFDAESSVAQELFDGDNHALQFQWLPMDSYTCRIEEFEPERTGPRCNTTSAYEAFRQFWDDNILEHIVRETNRYASELKGSSERFARDWYDTNVHELMILFAFWMMLGVIRMPSIKSCFSSNSLLKTNIFRTLMTEPRYWILTRALHFVNNSERTRESSKLFPLGPILDHLNEKFKEAYTPDQKVVIDESLMLWKGNLSFKQYIRTKAARFGIKTYELCESATGYLWSFIVYTGKDSAASPSKMPKSTEVVVQLIRPLLNKGYRLFLDNWFNSPVLARFLKLNKTDCVGTLRKSRKNVPALIQMATLPEGTCIARHSGDVVVMVYQDKKPVYTISTCHGTESVSFDVRPGRPAHYKPAAIADYNLNMGGVDKKDQMLEPYLIERKKNRKWYKKVFKRLLNVSINNSRIIADKSSDSQIKHQAFRLQLVNQILQQHLTSVPRPRQRPHANRYADLPQSRFVDVGVHFVVRNPLPETDDGRRTSGSNRMSKNRRSCLWCTVREGRTGRTVYMCSRCEIPLCLEGCFEKFHTVS